MRRKKSTDESVEPIAPIPAMKVVERREYTAPMPTAKPTEPQAITVQAMPVDNDDEGDDLLDFLAQLDEELGLILRVDRLPQYMTTGKWSKGAPFEYCDDLPISKQELKSGMYLTYLKQMFGPGAYRITLKESTGQFIKSWPVKIAASQAPIMTRNGQPAQSVVIHQAGESQAPRDTLQELLDAGEKVGKLRKVFGWDHEPPQAPVTPVAATVEREPLQDRIVEAALNFALKTEKPETVAGLLQSYLNPRQDDFSWKEIIGEIVKPMIPMFMGLVSAYMQNQAAKAQQTAQQANMAQNTQPQQALAPATPQPAIPHSVMFEPDPQPVAMPTMPTAGVMFNPMPMAQPEPEQESEEDMAESAENTLLDDLVSMLQECVNRAASDPAIIDAGRNEIAAFRKRFPHATQIIDLLASAPPVAVIGMLSFNYPQVAPLINNAVAIKVIEDLQAALRPSGPVQ